MRSTKLTRNERYAPATIAIYRRMLPGLRQQRDMLVEAERTPEQDRRLQQLEEKIRHREAVLAAVATEREDRAQEAARTADEAEFATLSDEELQAVVDAAAYYLLVDSARQYGLITGGPEVNVERSAAALAVGERRGIRPREERE